MLKKRITSPELGDSYLVVTHDSGLKIYLAKKSGYSSYYAIFGTRYGSIDTRFSRNGGEAISVPEGIAHFLEHKLFESEELDAFELFSKTGAYANAYTSFDRTCYLFGCSGNFEENLKILLGFVQSPYFTQETVEKEQGIIGQEIVMYEDDPDWRVMFNLLRAMYKTHPVRIDIAGTVGSIAEIDAELLYECYNTFYNPENMFLCIAGDFDEDKILELIDSELKPRERVTVERCFEPEQEDVETHLAECQLAVANPLFMMGFKDTVEGERPPMKRIVAMEVLLDIMCGNASPLYKRLLDGGLIGDNLDSEYFTTHGMAAVLIGGEGEHSREIADLILAEAERLRRDGLDPEMFEIVRRAKYGSCVSSFDNVQTIASMMVASCMLGVEIFEEAEILKTLTEKDVMDCLDIFTPEKFALSIIKGE